MLANHYNVLVVIFRIAEHRLARFLAPVLCLGFLPSLTAQQQKIGQVYASDATVEGSVTLASGILTIGNGSKIKAGQHTASIRLTRGGELRVCPGTSLSVNASSSGKELMLGMGTGALEADYPLPASADVVLTPDLRILLSGPGEAKVAITSNARGDTCVRSLGEESYVVVTELIGDATYRVKPKEQVFFPGAQIGKATPDSPLVCGCPAPAPVERAEVTPSDVEGNKVASLPTVSKAPAHLDPETPVPPAKPGQVNVEVDAPFVFHGNNPEPDSTATLARVHMEKLPALPLPLLSAQPPQADRQAKTETEAKPVGNKAKRVVRKIGGFFAALFRR